VSLPVCDASGDHASGDGPAARLVHVRVMGPPEAVEEVARRLRHALPVAEESADYPRRRDLGVRRYLTVVVEPGESSR
jgi:hypothetical protein